jgi:uncharacterized protein YecE (DUF72 family)
LNNSSKIRIGTCAWSCDDWKGVFYPADLPDNRWLEFYSRQFNAVEVDSTFYHAPARHTTEHWNEQTPPGFRFALKMPREITHELKLRDCADQLGAFLASVEPLGGKLACILIQLPPSFSPGRDEHALKKFVMHLPREPRFAIEFRLSAWHLARIAHYLEQHHIAWAWSDLSSLQEQSRAAFEYLPQTTDFIYVRLLGELAAMNQLDHSSGHRYGALMWPRDSSHDNWAIKIRRHVDESSELLLFAGNHFEGFAPLTCQRLGARLGISLSIPQPETGGSRDSQIELL